MTESLTGSIEIISHRVDRLTIQIDDSFDGFRDCYERAVPEFQTDRFDSLVAEGADWQRVLNASSVASTRPKSLWREANWTTSSLHYSSTLALLYLPLSPE